MPVIPHFIADRSKQPVHRHSHPHTKQSEVCIPGDQISTSDPEDPHEAMAMIMVHTTSPAALKVFGSVKEGIQRNTAIIACHLITETASSVVFGES